MLKPTALFSPEPARGWIPWAILAPLLCWAFIFVPMVVAWVPLDIYGMHAEDGGPNGVAGLASFLLLPFFLTLVTVLAWVLGVEKRSLASIGLVRGGAARRFATGAGIGIVSILLVVAAIALAGAYAVGAWLPAWADAAALPGIALLLPCFVLQGSVEEIVIRGWLMSALARRANVPIAVIVSSALFSYLHYADGQAPLITINTFVFGLFAAAWALRAGHIWGVMGWHAAWNWLLCTGFGLPMTGIDIDLPALLVELAPRGGDVWTGGSQGPEGSIVCTVFFGVAAAGLFVAHARRGR